jgi:hypothetical protein
MFAEMRDARPTKMPVTVREIVGFVVSTDFVEETKMRRTVLLIALPFSKELSLTPLLACLFHLTLTSPTLLLSWFAKKIDLASLPSAAQETLMEMPLSVLLE